MAVKKLKLENVELEVAQRDLLREAAYMSSFAHPNITQLIGVVFNGTWSDELDSMINPSIINKRHEDGRFYIN